MLVGAMTVTGKPNNVNRTPIVIYFYVCNVFNLMYQVYSSPSFNLYNPRNPVQMKS